MRRGVVRADSVAAGGGAVMADPKTEARFGEAFTDQMVEWCGDNLEPEDVFTIDQLREWAREDGWVPAAEVTRKLAVRY